MTVLLMIVSILLIALVLLQSGKAEGASNIISGGNSDLFVNRKERGGELFITRMTLGLVIAFFVISVAGKPKIRRFTSAKWELLQNPASNAAQKRLYCITVS